MPGVLEPILAVMVVLDGLLDLGLGGHDEGAMLHDGLVQRLAADQDKPQGLRRPVPHAEAVAGAQHQRVVAGRRGRLGVPEHAFSLQDVDEGVPVLGDSLVNLRARMQREVEIHGRRLGVDR